MPISRGPGAADAQQAARLFCAIADPTRLAILLTLQKPGNGASSTSPPNSVAPKPTSPPTWPS